MKVVSLIFIISTLACVNSNTSNKAVTELAPVTTAKDPSKHEDVSTCQLDITPATTTQKDKFAFQVKNFNANDISCWESLKSYGISFCQNKFPCRVIYIENDHLGSDKKEPFYPDFDVLKKYGIGEFTKFNDGGWQLAGSDAMSWERNKEGFDYFDDQTNY